jgi:hypothetical protein
MGTDGTLNENDSAGEGQQQFTGLDRSKEVTPQ